MLASNDDNKQVALRLAAHGIAVFPSLQKRPVPHIWQKLDTDVTAEDRTAAAERAKRKNKPAPKLFGSTLKPHRIKKLWLDMPEAVASVSCGPSNLVVVDADRNEKGDGPSLVLSLFEQHGVDLSAMPCTVTKSDGRHFYFLNPDGVGCGKIRSLNVDVKGVGGQVVAPGCTVVSSDGAIGRYRPADSHPDLCEALQAGTIPPLPPCIVDLMEAVHDHADSEPAIAAAYEQLTAVADVDLQSLQADIDALLLKDEEFRHLWDAPTGDHSEDRFTVAKCMLREYGPNAFTAAHLGALYATYEGAGAWVDSSPAQGEYDDRAIAREWVRAQRAGGKIVDTSLLGDVSGSLSEKDIASSDPYDRLPDSKPDLIGRAAKSLDAGRSPWASSIFAREPKPVEYLLKGLLMVGETVVAAGPPAVGKSVNMEHMAAMLAAGKPYHQFDTKPTGVLYASTENIDEDERRLLAIRRRYDLAPNLPLRFHHEPVTLFSLDGRPTKDEHKLIALARSFEPAGYPRCKLIVLDNLRRIIAPGETNNEAHIILVFQAVERIRDATGCTVLVIHHAVREGNRYAGSGAIESNVDSMWFLGPEGGKEPKKGVPLAISFVKLRMGSKNQEIPYAFGFETVAKTIDGEDIQTVVAIPRRGPTTGEALGDVSEQEGADLLSADDVLGIAPVAPVRPEFEKAGEADGAEKGAKAAAKPDRLLSEGAAQNERREALIDLLLSGVVERIPHGRHAGGFRAEAIALHDEEIRRLFDAGNFSRDFQKKYLRGEPSTGTKRGRIGVERGGKAGTIVTFQAQRNGAR